MMCPVCSRERATDERWEEFESFYEAARSIDFFEFAAPPEPPFCLCCPHGIDPMTAACGPCNNFDLGSCPPAPWTDIPDDDAKE